MFGWDKKKYLGEFKRHPEEKKITLTKWVKEILENVKGVRIASYTIEAVEAAPIHTFDGKVIAEAIAPPKTQMAVFVHSPPDFVGEIHFDGVFGGGQLSRLTNAMAEEKKHTTPVTDRVEKPAKPKKEKLPENTFMDELKGI